MPKRYARGRFAVGECARSGRKMLLKDMVSDGYYPNLVVDPAWYEGKHPQESLPEIEDPVALWRPAPERDRVDAVVNIVGGINPDDDSVPGGGFGAGGVGGGTLGDGGIGGAGGIGVPGATALSFGFEIGAPDTIVTPSPPDPLSLDFTTPNAGGLHSVVFDFNRLTTSVLGAALYLNLATFAAVDFVGASNITQDRVLSVANLDNNRYRMRRISGDEATTSTAFATNLPIGDWSVWRGGNPGAPLQQDAFRYSLFVPGSLSGTWQIQIEEPDGSAIIIIDRTLSLSLTVT